MKKAILFVVALILLSIITNAQSKSFATGGKVFDENTRIINVGFGLTTNYYRYTKGIGYETKNSPAISISYEQPWKKRLGPGYLGVGAYLGFQSSSYRYENHYYNNQRYYYQHSYKNIMVAGRAMYHWDGMNWENAEIYGGAIMGVRIQTYSYSTNSDDPDLYTTRASSNMSILPAFSVIAGARWYFVPKVAVFGELSGGYSIPYLTVGVSFKI